VLRSNWPRRLSAICDIVVDQDHPLYGQTALAQPLNTLLPSARFSRSHGRLTGTAMALARYHRGRLETTSRRKETGASIYTSCELHFALRSPTDYLVEARITAACRG
jgi:hypothetical protein